MSTGRLEAFSDGVLAIIITIMVLEMKVPEGSELESLRPVLHVFQSYVLSFVYLGIYWNNHHHLFQASERVTGAVLWSNLHLLFWLSLIPFASGWMGRNPLAPAPVALYGAILLFAGVAYFILSRMLIRAHEPDSKLVRALGKDRKGVLSLILYAAAAPLAFVSPVTSYAIYVVVAILWLVPDRRLA